jgi:uncharacterized protein
MVTQFRSNEAPGPRWRVIALFFGVAFAISWSAWSILFGLHLSHIQGAGFSIYVVAILAPHASAVLSAAHESGSSGVREFYRTVFRPTKARWIVVSIATPVVIYLIRYAIGVAFGETAGAPVFHAPDRTLFILLFGQTVVALGEEPGWRGFAQSRLISLLGTIPGSVVLGVAWAAWHLPLFLIPGTAQYGTSFITFLITLVAWSIVVTYLVCRARGSGMVAMLFHASANLCDFTVWEPHSSVVSVMPWVLAAALAAWQLEKRGGDVPGAD